MERNNSNQEAQETKNLATSSETNPNINKKIQLFRSKSQNRKNDWTLDGKYEDVKFELVLTNQEGFSPNNLYEFEYLHEEGIFRLTKKSIISEIEDNQSGNARIQSYVPFRMSKGDGWEQKCKLKS